jgi:nicotinamidase-related amidase
MSERDRFTEFLTVDNAAVVLVDHQVGLISGVRDISVAELKHNVAGLARAAHVLGLPVVATTTAADSMWGPMIPELRDALPADQVVIDRSTVNAWHDDHVREAIKATGRQKLIFAGISLEVCAALPAIAAVAEGYDAYVALDASGTFWDAKRTAGIVRMQQAGVILTDYSTAMVEILRDNSSPSSPALYAALDMPFAVLVGQIAEALGKH